MKTPNSISTLFLLVLLVIFSCICANEHNHFLECLSKKSHNYSAISDLVYTTSTTSYSSTLQFSISNLRFASNSTPKPQLIITPEHESQIPPIILCAKENCMEIRTRSGGHDFEGLSYVSKVPFLIIDLIKLSKITVDAEVKTAWVEAGATIGSLYYKIAEKSSTLGFPAGICPTVGVGGHFSGGGYGFLMRKYGLAADQVIDARIVDVNGRILDRESMGEDLFWAIRGGGGASFGVIVAWKVQLVDVPETVTVFTVQRTFEQNATQLIHRWQYLAPKFDKDLLVGITIGRVNFDREGKNFTVGASFFSLFLGGVDKLVPLMQECFPELGLVREDCIEMSWVQSVLYHYGYPIKSPEVLLNRTQPGKSYFKGKPDYVQKPISENGLQGYLRNFFKPEAKAGQALIVPYGGRMDEISESAIPYPHRAGNLYTVGNIVFWQEDEVQNSDKYISWIRKLYSYMTPYVSNSPRASYINYRDLDIGVNNNEGKTSYAQASIWGKRYFKNNFDRLVRVKTIVDPNNFFRNEQSIPSLHSI